MAAWMVKITRTQPIKSIMYLGPYSPKREALQKLREHMGEYEVPGRTAEIVRASSLLTIGSKL